MRFLRSFQCFGHGSRGTGGNHGSPDDAGDLKQQWIPIIKKEAKKRKARMKKLKEQDELQAKFEARIARLAASSNGKKKEKKKERKYQDVSEDSIYIYIREPTGTNITIKTIQPGHHIYIITH